MPRSTRSRRLNTVGGSEGTIEIVGLADFNRALRNIDGGFAPQLKQANYDAAKALSDAAKAKARSMSHRTAAKAARSLRVSRSASYAAISAGGPRFPYFYGAEFGSKHYGQFQSWRGNQWNGWAGGPGYFLHPAIRKEGPKVLRDYMAKIDELTAQAFPDAA